MGVRRHGRDGEQKRRVLDQRQWSDSGATENMIPDPTCFERYDTALPGHRVEMGDGTLLPVACYGDLRLKVEQDDANGGQTRDRMLRRVAHVPDLKHDLLSAAQLSAMFERSDAAVATGRCFLGARATDSL